MNPTFLTYAAVCFSCAATQPRESESRLVRCVRSLLMCSGGAAVVVAYVTGGGA